jgi:hypothetical protein
MGPCLLLVALLFSGGPKAECSWAALAYSAPEHGEGLRALALWWAQEIPERYPRSSTILDSSVSREAHAALRAAQVELVESHPGPDALNTVFRLSGFEVSRFVAVIRFRDESTGPDGQSSQCLERTLGFIWDEAISTWRQVSEDMRSCDAL